MAKVVGRRWVSEDQSGLPRRDRQSCEYEVYIPDRLAGRLLRAEAARDLGEETADVTASEVLGNIDSMTHVISSVTEGDPITLELLLETHRRLLAGSRLEEHG